MNLSGSPRPSPSPAGRHMKRFIGLSLVVVGGAVVAWAGFHALSGQTNTPLMLTPEFSVSALTAGLVGVVVCVVGLVWVRD
jgi:drug/metabolite transporter (DMT)-like permease